MAPDTAGAPRGLSAAMVRFGALLRQRGLPVTPGQVTDGARALDVLDLSDRDEIYLGLRTVFVSQPEDVPTFDLCFDAFWRLRAEPEEGIPGLIAIPPSDAGDAPQIAAGGQKRDTLALDTWSDEDDEGEDAGEPLGVPGVSDREAIVAQDFSTFSADQLDEVLKLTILIARRLARRLSRRRRPARRRGRLDLRRTFRANLSRGEIIDLRYRQRKRRKIRLVLLCDVSGSMDLYSRFLLQFLFALQNVFGRVETFTFSTRLTRVTEYLRGRSYRRVLRQLTDVRDWSGGTRIGESLGQFNREWSHLMDRRTIVILLSDGWDTGEPEVLAAELMRIRRRAGRLIWLNPLLGNPSYEPLTRGMAAALPLVHVFAPAHNLAALRDLARRLDL
ncbi:MAG: VWA domain-containing protein [Candidatus Rokubacteria bacterium]|nr:VWA domain-containing protein [Candidatus Rokubacteria bacterium]MBI3827421.1 VWA domain-containing protein [Candidatus Rokubacteria bacterium]